MDFGISRFIPTDYIGPQSNIAPLRSFPREPLTTDKKYPVGQLVILSKDPSTGTEGDIWYLSKFDSSGDAIWLQLSVGAGSPGIDTITTDDGAPPVEPDGSGNVDILGGTGIDVTGQGPGNTVTVSAGIDVATTYTEDTGTATPAANNLNVVGAGGISTSGSGDTVTITDGGLSSQSFPTDSGTATPSGGELDILGGSNINTSGATNVVTVNLDDDINVHSVTIDPQAAEDGWLQFSESSTAKWRIGNDATDDSFRISQGSALGTNDTFIMTSDGERTMPLNPAFLAFLGSSDTNATGDNTQYFLGATTVLTEIYDQGSDFTTAGVFMAPVTGKYAFSFVLQTTNFTSSHTQGNTTSTTSNRLYRGMAVNPYVTVNVGGGLRVPSTVYADMDAGDTATFEVTITGGTKTVTVVGGTNGTYCCGFLAT